MSLSKQQMTQLIQAAFGQQQNAYAVYSRYQVGAALLCSDGTVYGGANVENASSPAGICAERAAFAAAVSDGKRGFDAIAIVGGKPGEDSPALPCGICRQVMSEFCGDDFQIIVAASPSDYQVYSLSKLFPFAFRLTQK